ncbi:hypothetical protein K504DRAFT_466596 [Pleomassaria siparia CBS 279.74]|uniref:YMC020W-like alpha/beta hydrolase domain-containing protein n=1 Tax=Pleomassaria siparia CBS 279.74 TaxID=1314801 RepID=A0A6G1KB99_9PLEO|nr:hypothetical protein K504DRAFT_466596 [Pleomassaria siparia CBS 279.74]
MSPRKKSKPNSQAPAADDKTESTSAASAEASTSTSPPSAPTENTAEISRNAPSNKSMAEASLNDRLQTASSLNKKASRKWLGGGGSWRSKAPAIVKTAKESIGVAGGATSALPGKGVPKPQDESSKKFLTKRKSSKGSAIPAAMTKLNVSSDGSIGETQEAPKQPDSEPPVVGEPPLPPDPPKIIEPTSRYGWGGWWSRPDGYDATKTDDAQKTPLPGPTPSEETSKELGTPADVKDIEIKDTPPEDMEMSDAPPLTDTSAKVVSGGSWFWSWSTAQNAQTTSPAEPPKSDEAPNPPGTTNEEPSPEVEPPKQPDATVDTPAGTVSKQSAKPSGWAFWFKDDKPKEEKKLKSTDDGRESMKQVGEVAVFNTPSQSNPEAAQFNEQEAQPKDAAKEPLKPVPADEPVAKKSFVSLRGRSKAKTAPKHGSTLSLTPSSSKTVTPSSISPAPPLTRLETAPGATAQTVSRPPSKIKQEPPNLILPEFKSTYRLVQKPSYWQQIRQYLLGDEQSMPHLHINPSPPRIKKAVAIGVHGYFPAAILQKVLGQPQGTSIRFANAAAAAIKDWAGSRGYTPEIEQIALEGEGFIAERVNTLWKLLLNWIDQIKEADFILVACHSQGVPVAIMLVAKLIQFGCVNNARIGVCAMAGVNMGPFTDYKTRYLGQTAAELFEFGNPKSLVSQMYLAGLDEALRNGVRIFYVGSIDDQLVSLESSTFSTISHPYIYRAVFVDGRIHVPDFLTHLVGFVLKLRNLGLPDHGLIRELSPAVAGSLYAGEGHSRVYEDSRIYDLAVQHALETTSLPILSQQQNRPGTSASFKGINIPVPGAKIDDSDKYALRVKDYDAVGAGSNPYYLPWAMRGLLEEEVVKRQLGQEVEELLGMFEDWKPTSKGLKDVKFRLEMVKSRL